MHNIYALGGTVKAMTELANTLADKGHNVEIISILELKICLTSNSILLLK